MYIIGGGTPNPTGAPIDVYCYHFDTNTWKRPSCQPVMFGGHMPIARRSHTCVLYERKIYMFGGTDGIHMFDDFWYLDLDTFVWHPIRLHTQAAGAKCFHAAAVTPEVCRYVHIFFVGEEFGNRERERKGDIEERGEEGIQGLLCGQLPHS